MNQAASTSSGWKKAFATPVSQLLRGRITGPLTLLDMLDTSEIPSTVVNAMQVILKPLPRRLRSQATRQLVLSCKMQLQAGRTESQLLEQLNDTKNITSLIRKTRTASWVFEFNLPDNLWSTITAIVDQSRRQKAAVLNCICRGFQSQLQAGRTDDDLASRYSDAIAIGKMIQQTKSPEIFLASDLPENVVHVVLDVVKRTRLWPAEKSEAAQELFAHFTDGLAQGSSAEELIASFGCPKISAKLIRRASIRKRSLAWHTWRRTWQSTAAFFAIILVTWTTLAARFMLAEPTIKYDLIQQFDNKSRAIPENERAWPLYRQGIVMLVPPPLERDATYRKEWKEINDGLSKGPKSKHWPEAKAYLKEHADVLELFLEATSRPQLGFINRDPDNWEWLKASGHIDAFVYNPSETIDGHIRLLQAQDLREYASSLLSGAIYFTAEQGDAERCLQLLHARFEVASHIRQTFSCLLPQLVANYQQRETTQQILQILLEKPEVFDNSQVEIISKEVAASKVESSYMFSSEWMMQLDVIQRTYTDDGHGNGRITLSGFRFLLGFMHSSMMRSSEKKLLMDLILPPKEMNVDLQKETETVSFQLKIAPLAAVFADRNEMQEKLFHLHQLLQEVGTKEDFSESEYMVEYQRLFDSPYLRRKYLLALLVMPGAERPICFPKENPYQVSKNAALITIAAELYRRSHGKFPATAAEQVPEFLAEIPIDPFTEKPLSYSLQEGRPHIDSEGLRLFEETK